MQGVTAFNFADRVMVGSMFKDAGGGDEKSGADIVKKWTIELQSLITTFHAETMTELFTLYGLIRKGEEAELRDQYCAAHGSVSIPISTLEI
jgi:hypothetical protein